MVLLLPLLEEKIAHIGAVNTVVANDAGRPVRVLRAVHASRDLLVALEAERVDACGEQQARVGGGMRGVAGGASLNPDGLVLENERPPFVGVALHANEVLIGR